MRKEMQTPSYTFPHREKGCRRYGEAGRAGGDLRRGSDAALWRLEDQEATFVAVPTPRCGVWKIRRRPSSRFRRRAVASGRSGGDLRRGSDAALWRLEDQEATFVAVPTPRCGVWKIRRRPSSRFRRRAVASGRSGGDLRRGSDAALWRLEDQEATFVAVPTPRCGVLEGQEATFVAVPTPRCGVWKIRRRPSSRFRRRAVASACAGARG